MRRLKILRKMFLAMAKDIRVIIIKLADRLHNMRTLAIIAAGQTAERSPAKRWRSMRRSRIVWASGASNGTLKTWRLRYLDPESYHEISANA